MSASTFQIALATSAVAFSSIEQVAREGARRALQKAIEDEVSDYLNAHRDQLDSRGHRLVVRNGTKDPRTVLTGVGPMEVCQPRVDDRRVDERGQRFRFTSRILPPYLRKTQTIEELMPWLYLKGIGTNDMSDALVHLGFDGSVDLLRANGDAAPNRMTQRLIAGSERVNHLAATPDESHLIVTLATGEVGVMSVDPAPQVNVPLHGVFGAAVAPNQSKIAGGAWGVVQCVDTLIGLPLWGRNLGPENNRFLTWSPDGSRLLVVTAAQDTGQSDVFLLDGNTGEQLAAWCGSPVTLDPARAGQSLDWARNVAGICFDPNGETLFVAHTDGSCSRVNASTWSVIDSMNTDEWKAAITLEGEFFADLKISPDGGTLAQLTSIIAPGKSALGPLTLRDTRNGQIVRRIDRPGMGAVAFAFSPDSSTLAVSFSDPVQSRVVLVDPRTGHIVFDTALDSIAPIRSITFTHDGQRIAAFTQAGRALLFDVATGQIISSPFTTQAVNSADHSPDGALFVSGGGVLLQRAETRKPSTLSDTFFNGWPATVPHPTSIDDARRKVARAYRTLNEAYASAQSIEAFLNTLRATDPATANFVRALLDRFPPSINMLNSDALKILISPSPTPAELARACEMLTKAIAIKPTSASLTANLGTVLFIQENYKDCIAPLETSGRLRAQRNLPPSALSLLRMAIATRTLNDPRADAFVTRAKQVISDQSLQADPEVVLLLKRLDTTVPAK